MRVYHAASYTAYCEPIAGGTSWVVDFDDGYIDKSYIRAKTLGFDDKWQEVRVETRRIVGNTVILAKPLQPCRVLLIQRDTPKDERLVRYGFGGTLLQDEARETANRQSMHVIAELVDAGKLLHTNCICGCSSEV